MAYSTYCLGTTDEEAQRAAYKLAYDRFDSTSVNSISEGDNREDMAHPLSDREEVQILVGESKHHSEFWMSLENYYETHCAEDQQFTTVAEEIDAAYHTGAYTALANDDSNPEGDLAFALNP